MNLIVFKLSQSLLSTNEIGLTIAHELWHLLFHLDSCIAPLEHLEENDKEEKQAHVFAGELLLPAAGLKKQWEQYKGIAFIDRVLAIKHLYKINYKTVL